MDKPFYLPVDPPLPLEQVRQFTPEQLAARTLYDPHYAGFDPKFDWHDYVALNMKNGPFKKEVEAALDHMATTEEGQHTLRQAAALWNIEKQHGNLRHFDDTLDTADFMRMGDAAFNHRKRTEFAAATDKIIIDDDKKFATALSDGGCAASLAHGTVHLNEAQIRHFEPLATDGKLHHESTENYLKHELGHLMDPLNLYLYRGLIEQRSQATHAQVETNLDRALRQAGFHGHLPTGDLKALDQLSQHLLAPAAYAALHARDEALVERNDAQVEYPTMRDANAYNAHHLHEFERAMVYNQATIVDAAEPLKPLPTGKPTARSPHGR